MAAEYQERGFLNAMVLDGGLKAWREAGYPIMS
jgi:rhodanese-related sulfurtransferase